MDPITAKQQLREHCNTISITTMKIHPLLKNLGDEAAKAEILKALHEVTKHIETIKKQLMRTEQRDESTLL